MRSKKIRGKDDGRSTLADAAGEGEADNATAAARLAFEQLASERRAEVKVHCYRMLGSLSDAEDMTQETFARAWHARGELANQASARPWLYRIATNACLDALRRRKRERRLWGDPVPMVVGAELGPPDLDVDWLEPMPNSVISDVADVGRNPQASYEQAEALRLVFWPASNSCRRGKGRSSCCTTCSVGAPPRLGPLSRCRRKQRIACCNGRGARSMPPISASPNGLRPAIWISKWRSVTQLPSRNATLMRSYRYCIGT